MTNTDQVPARNTEEAAVLAALEATYAAWIDHDADGYAELYTEDATIVLPGIFQQGRESIRAFMKAGFDGPMKGTRPVDKPQHVRLLNSRTAIVVSESVILFPGETSASDDRLRRANWVLTKDDDDRWLVTAYLNTPLH